MKNKKFAESLSKDQKRQRWKYEILAKDIFDRFKIQYEWQKPFYTSFRYICADFYLPEINIVIELDGSCHKKKKDKKRDSWLMANFKIKTVRIKNFELKKNPSILLKVLNENGYPKVF